MERIDNQAQLTGSGRSWLPSWSLSLSASNFSYHPAGEKMVLQSSDACAPGVKEAGAATMNEQLDIIHEHDTFVHCKKCRSPGARIHSETWSDGLVYVDYGCPACGYSEVFD